MDHETFARTVTALARLEAADPHADRGGYKSDIRRFLHNYAGGKCAMCGGPTRLDGKADEMDTAEISHIISVGDSKRGIGVGNVFNGCRACNLDTSDKDLTRYLHLFADVFAIPTEWPSFGQMRQDKPKAADRSESRKRREALGFDF